MFSVNAISALDDCCRSAVVGPNTGLTGFLETSPAPCCNFPREQTVLNR